jgi:hypothetical protein
MPRNNAKQLKTLFKEIMMTKTFSELRKINVNEHIEKKGNLSYLSWAWAVDYLLQEDSTATWYFDDPKCFGETVMVSCTVAAMGKQMTMHLPVMDNKNNAVKNPDARKISDAMMRCLAKCIACFGIGLYVYAGEDVPSQDAEPLDVDAMLQAIAGAETLEQLKEIYISTIKTAKGNQPAMRELELAKDARKVELQKVAE